jgi:hypothetical protein
VRWQLRARMPPTPSANAGQARVRSSSW